MKEAESQRTLKTRLDIKCSITATMASNLSMEEEKAYKKAKVKVFENVNTKRRDKLICCLRSITIS